MQWVGYAELASAVSNAGGLGIVSRSHAGDKRYRSVADLDFAVDSIDATVTR